MTGQQLKNSILQMAVQGKLVPQDPNDEPASILLERIKKEKEQLVKEGKIKKEKNPSYIFRGPDSLPYEKVGNNEPVCIADEVPFEIPDSWEWVHLSDIAISGLGKTLNKSIDDGTDTPYLCSINVYWTGIDLTTVKTAKFTQTDRDRYLLQKGDLLICEGGDVGRSAVWNYDKEMYYQNALHRVRFLGKVNPYFFLYLLECYKSLKIIEEYSKGVTIKHFVQSSLNAMFLPLPPLNEQQRIVEKLSEVIPLTDSYAKAYIRAVELNQEFPELLKKSILQEAVQGKLVPQDQSDEPASVLLERIRVEKQRLIKEGKIKKDKHESIIFRRDNSYYEKLDGIERCVDDEIPFEIPDSWECVRLKELCFIINGFTPLRTNVEYWENPTIHWFTVDDIRRQGRRITSTIQSINEKALAKNTNRILPPGTVLLCCTASVGEFAITEIPLTTNQQFNGLVIKDYWKNYFWNEFLFTIAETFKDRLLLLAGKTTINFISVKKLENLVIPLPPINEQHRIVKKLKEISSYIE